MPEKNVKTGPEQIYEAAVKAARQKRDAAIAAVFATYRAEEAAAHAALRAAKKKTKGR